MIKRFSWRRNGETPEVSFMIHLGFSPRQAQVFLSVMDDKPVCGISGELLVRRCIKVIATEYNYCAREVDRIAEQLHNAEAERGAPTLF